MCIKCSSGLFSYSVSWCVWQPTYILVLLDTTSILTSSSPDKLQALVWALSSSNTPPPPPFPPIEPRRATSAHLGSSPTSSFASTLPVHLIKPRRALVACLGCLSTSPFTVTSHPAQTSYKCLSGLFFTLSPCLHTSTSPDELQAFVWASSSHIRPPPLSTLSSPDELHALVWDLLLSRHLPPPSQSIS